MSKQTEVTKNNSVVNHDDLGLVKPPRPAEVYDAVLEEGEIELSRGVPALWWSGVAAGLSMGFSVVATAALAVAFGEFGWSHPVVSIGYAAGFLIVILARQQLFTENTITALLPVLANYSWANTHHLLRLWGIVFLANIVGGLIFAWLTTQPTFFSDEIRVEILNLGHHLFENSATQMFMKGIAAGWLIATLVWVLPSANTGRFMIILFFTWLIALGEFTHIIAGSIEAFHMMFMGVIAGDQLLLQFMIPTLLGNIIGGSAIFSLISYAQVRNEVE